MYLALQRRDLLELGDTHKGLHCLEEIGEWRERLCDGWTSGEGQKLGFNVKNRQINK